MDWTKLPTNLLVQRLPDNEIISIIKYQSLWALLERQPTDDEARRYMTNKQLSTAYQWLVSIESQVTLDLYACNNKRRREKNNYLKNKEKREILPTEQRTECVQTVDSMSPKTRQDKIRQDKIRIKTKTKDVLVGLKIEDVVDFNSLFLYWEENKSGKKYKDNESRERMLNRLKKLTNDDLEYAKEAILFCIDNNYRGFSDGNKLYYNRPKSQPQEVDMEEYFRSL